MLLYVCTVQCTIYMVGTRCLGAELYFLVYPRSTHVIICMYTIHTWLVHATRCRAAFILLGVHMLLYVCTVQCTLYMVGTRCQVQTHISKFILE